MPNAQNGNDWYTLPINFSRIDSGKSLAGLQPEITSKLALIQKIFRRCSKIAQYQITIKGGVTLGLCRRSNCSTADCCFG